MAQNTQKDLPEGSEGEMEVIQDGIPQEEVPMNSLEQMKQSAIIQEKRELSESGGQSNEQQVQENRASAVKENDSFLCRIFH